MIASAISTKVDVEEILSLNEWRPNPGPQEDVLTRIEFEILYGGARGGGKTEAGIVWLLELIEDPSYRALVIRRNADDLSDWIDRASRFFLPLGAKKTGNPGVFKFPSGAKIKLGHLKDEGAYTKYQGHEYHRILIEELTQIPTEKLYLKLVASCRTNKKHLRTQIFATTNPGEVGHLWVKKRFVDIAYNHPFQDPISHRWRIYIPATMDDNPVLMENDPDYVNQIDALKATDVDLWKAWRHGSWDVFAGQFFKEFRRGFHTVKPFLPRKDIVKVGKIDWGFTAPFVFLGSAVQKVRLIGGHTFNRVWTYREIDSVNKQGDAVGQPPSAWARKIMEIENLDEYQAIYCDPAMFHKKEDGSISIADEFKKVFGIKYAHLLKPANNDRIGGWAVVHNWLSVAPDGLPYWIISEACPHLVETLPSLVHDETKVEDVETTGPDHWSDASRYGLVHIRWINAKIGTVVETNPVLGNVKNVQSAFVQNLDTNEFANTADDTGGRDWRAV